MLRGRVHYTNVHEPLYGFSLYADAALAAKVAEAMLERGVYVIAFSYPVVPNGKARIRTQMSAAHTSDDIDKAITAFAEVRKQLL
jgi:glycine C-acetyltransferase